jgi:deazaflavin-dependent oxidoreductase (nitroreductase family)
MKRIKSRSAVWYLFRAPVHLYHWGFGRLLGHRFLLLTHIGRRTGAPHETVLEVMEYREQGPEVIVMGGFGRESDWIQNIEATPRARVDIDGQHFAASMRPLSEDEAVNVVRGYEYRNRWMAPIVRFALSRLTGWKYTGSDSDRHRLVRQLPLFALQATA